MTKFIDYNQILDDVKSLVETKVVSMSPTVPYKLVGTNLMTRDFVFANMPLCDVRLANLEPQTRVGQDYYSGLLVELEIAAFSLNSKDKAARIANELLSLTQRALIENAHFGAVWESISLGHVDFMTAEGGKEGFAASLVAQVQINIFSDK